MPFLLALCSCDSQVTFSLSVSQKQKSLESVDQVLQHESFPRAGPVCFLKFSVFLKSLKKSILDCARLLGLSLVHRSSLFPSLMLIEDAVPS